MTEKAFITSQNTAKLECPKCQRSKIIDASKYSKLDRKLQIRVKCPCGNIFAVLLERRKQYRKETDISGSFIHYIDGKVAGRGLMTVCDLSLTGMKLRVDYEYQFSVGDLLEVRFLLDNPRRSLMHKEVIVKSTKMPHLGTEFNFSEKEDKALGFYLLK
jgi:hypothetical protein